MKRILGVNGIHNWSWSNDSFTDRILARLSVNNMVIDVKYPWMNAMFAMFDWTIKRRAKIIAKENLSEQDCVVAHSFGCLAVLYAMEFYGAKFDKVIFFAAAAEPDYKITRSFNVMYNIHSKTDYPLTLARFLPRNKMGNLGQIGYKGDMDTVVNIDATGFDHSDYVHSKNICDWVKIVEEMLEAETLKEVIAPANLVGRPAYNANVEVTLGRNPQ